MAGAAANQCVTDTVLTDRSTEVEGMLTVDRQALDDVPLERLEQEISGFAARLAAATARWLLWIAAYDRRRGWETWEAKSCAHWLNWQCGMSTRSAREHVSVAHSLTDLALVREAFLAGELSYSKVRAICRVVRPENESDLVQIARETTASQLERIAAKLPRTGTSGTADLVEEVEADASAVLSRSGVDFRQNNDGTVTMTITSSAANMAVAKAALRSKTYAVIERETREGDTRTDVIDRLGGLGLIDTETALALMSGTVDAAVEPQANVLVVANLDVLTEADDNAESTVDHKRTSPAIMRRLSCDSVIQAAVLGADGGELGLGAESRIVPRRIRRLLLRRDHGTCRFPGCDSEHRLHAHHVIHWARGGKTDVSNLISLCHFHHRSVHEGGWTVRAVGSRWVFSDRKGKDRAIPMFRSSTVNPLPRQKGNGTAAPLAASGERCDAHYIADVIIENT